MAADDYPASDQRAPQGTSAGRSPITDSSRVEAFSDGVFAIAITLLVLDLTAPARRGMVLHDLLGQWPAYTAYLASFAYIGVIWVNHHQLFTRIAHVDAPLLWCNLVLLLPASVLPFPTAVVASAFQHGDRGDERAALIFYAAIAASEVAAWLLLFHFLSRAPHLLEDEVHARFFARERQRSAAGLALYAISALSALWYPNAGLAVACTLPVFYGLTSGGWRLRRPGRRQRADQNTTGPG